MGSSMKKVVISIVVDTTDSALNVMQAVVYALIEEGGSTADDVTSISVTDISDDEMQGDA